MCDTKHKVVRLDHPSDQKHEQDKLWHARDGRGGGMARRDSGGLRLPSSGAREKSVKSYACAGRAGRLANGNEPANGSREKRAECRGAKIKNSS